MPWCSCLVCGVTFDDPRSWADHSISLGHLERRGPGVHGDPDEIPSKLRRRRLNLVFHGSAIAAQTAAAAPAGPMEMVNALGLEPVPRRVTWAASPMLSESASAAPQDSRVEEERASPTPSERPRRRTHPGSRPGAPAYRTRGLDSIEG